MPRQTLQQLLAMPQIASTAAAQQYIDFCVWQQARPAIVKVLESCDQPAYALQAEEAGQVAILAESTQQAATAILLRRGIPVMQLAAVQGIAGEMKQIATAVEADLPDLEAMSFHAARLVGWAAWADYNFGTGSAKAHAEEAAYAKQLQTVHQLLGVAGV